MTAREIRTSQETELCDVCGRSLLRGERTETWISAGSRRAVCELCTARARHEGWIREGARLDAPNGRARVSERRRSFIERLREGGERMSERARRPAAESLDESGARANGHAAEEPPRAPARSAPGAGALGDPYGAARESRHVRAVPTDPEHRVLSALEVFNASDYPRTVAGVARSLGVPAVVVRPAPSGSRVAIVVSWELSWYRYEVDLADPQAGVDRVGQGYELSELSEEDRTANAAADEHGRLHLAAA